MLGPAAVGWAEPDDERFVAELVDSAIAKAFRLVVGEQAAETAAVAAAAEAAEEPQRKLDQLASATVESFAAVADGASAYGMVCAQARLSPPDASTAAVSSSIAVCATLGVKVCSWQVVHSERGGRFAQYRIECGEATHGEAATEARSSPRDDEDLAAREADSCEIAGGEPTGRRDLMESSGAKGVEMHTWEVTRRWSEVAKCVDELKKAHPEAMADPVIPRFEPHSWRVGPLLLDPVSMAQRTELQPPCVEPCASRARAACAAARHPTPPRSPTPCPHAEHPCSAAISGIPRGPCSGT